MRLVGSALAVAVVAGTAVLALAGPAAALSCVEFGEVARSSHQVFTGTITEVEDDRATVDVDTVWKGNVGRTITVELAWFEAFGAVPAPGQRYTVGLRRGEPANNCSMWPADEQHVDAALEKAFGEPTRRYEPSDPSDGPAVIPLVVGGIAAVAVGAVVWGLVRRRR